ncbi:MAG TPA: hypothetical protein VHB53_05825 [Solirubrobacterales bacterium]|nr:hypothetical protein [Solirubrobacterales bacterium]
MTTARLRHRFLLLALPALLAAAALGSPAIAAGNTVATGIVCSTYNATAGTATVRFGYANSNTTTEDIAPGDYNYFTPPPPDVGQPNQFLPGIGSFDLTRSAGSASLTWVINEVAGEAADFAAADLPFERPCPERGPSISGLTPPAAIPGAGPRSLAIFGQGLAGGSVTVSGEGIAVSTDGPGTEQRLDATVTVAPDAATGARDVLVTAPNGDQVGCRGCLMIEGEPAPVVGPAGPIGPTGERGATGERGPAGPGGTVIHVTGKPVPLGVDGNATAVARCPAGSTALAGGYSLRGKGALHSLAVLTDQPRGANAWSVTVSAGGAKSSRRLVVSASCLG